MAILDRVEDRPQRGELRRIARLFRPYRGRLSTVLALIALSAGLSMISPFLLREVLDQAIPQGDTRLLTALVGGMIAISIATGALGVGQTWLSNLVGQRVMHDLRSAVFRHLQRLSLAFFTRTRTGEVQSRIANDIGGVQNVVTSTATSIVSNVTTVVATIAAMFALDWRLAAFSLALLPFFVWLTRRVGRERNRITAQRQGRSPTCRSLVEESLSVSGILLGKTMGRAPELADRFTRESARARRPRGAPAHGRPLAHGQRPDGLRDHARARVLVRGPEHRLGRPRDLDRHRSSPSPRCRRGCSSRCSRCSRSGSTSRPRSRSSTASSSTSTSPSTSPSASGAVELDAPAGERRASRTSRSATTRTGRRRSTASTSWCPAGTKTAIVGETGSGKTTLGYLVARLYDPTEGRVTIDGVDVRDADVRVARAHRRARLPGDLPVPRLDRREPALRPARRHRRRARGRRARRADPRAHRRPARRLRHVRRRARLPLLAAARSSASRSPARSCATRPCSSSTRPRARSTTRPSAPSRRRSTSSPRAARRSPSPTGCRRSATPTRSSSSTDGRIVERGTHAELLARGGRYAALAARAGEPEAELVA